MNHEVPGSLDALPGSWEAALILTSLRMCPPNPNEIPDVEVIVYDDTGHYCFLDREADVIAAMKSFLGRDLGF